MKVQLLRDQDTKIKLIEQAFEKAQLPQGVRVWIGNPDYLNCIDISATVSAKIIGLNVVLDLLHLSVCLYILRTQSDIVLKVKGMVARIWDNYKALIPNQNHLPIPANPGISNKI